MAEFREIAHIDSDKEKYSSGIGAYADKVRSKSQERAMTRNNWVSTAVRLFSRTEFTLCR